MPKKKKKPAESFEEAKGKDKDAAAAELLASNDYESTVLDILAKIPPPIAPSFDDLIAEFRPKEGDGRPHVSKKGAFLQAYIVTAGNITRAAAAVGVTRQLVWIWRERDPKFAAAYAKASERAVDILEDEGRRRAFEGTRKGIYFEGRLCDVEIIYSDAIWLSMMRAKREEYRKSTVSGTGKDGSIPISLIVPEHLKNATDEQLRSAAERLEQAIADARESLQGTGPVPGSDAVSEHEPD